MRPNTFLATPCAALLCAGLGRQGPKTMAYNPAENCLLITSDAEGGCYELYTIPKEAARGDTAPVCVSVVVVVGGGTECAGIAGSVWLVGGRACVRAWFVARDGSSQQ
jgi:hypothetical protein